jgi:hypothetical protein
VDTQKEILHLLNSYLQVLYLNMKNHHYPHYFHDTMEVVVVVGKTTRL